MSMPLVCVTLPVVVCIDVCIVFLYVLYRLIQILYVSWNTNLCHLKILTYKSWIENLSQVKSTIVELSEASQKYSFCRVLGQYHIILALFVFSNINAREVFNVVVYRYGAGFRCFALEDGLVLEVMKHDWWGWNSDQQCHVRGPEMSPLLPKVASGQ